jgi:hypothetical protein
MMESPFAYGTGSRVVNICNVFSNALLFDYILRTLTLTGIVIKYLFQMADLVDIFGLPYEEL